MCLQMYHNSSSLIRSEYHKRCICKSEMFQHFGTVKYTIFEDFEGGRLGNL